MIPRSCSEETSHISGTGVTEHTAVNHSDQRYSLKNEMELSSKNEAYQIYKYKKVSNIINNGTMTKNFSTITEYGNQGFLPEKNASKFPGFAFK